MSSEAVGLSVICRVDGRMCALPISQVVETLRPLPIEPMNGAREFVLGLAVIRGAAVPVVDLSAVLGGSAGHAPASERWGRFVTVRAGDRRVALAVSEVLGVRTIDVRRLEELPPLLKDAPTSLVSAIGILDDQFLLVLRSARWVVDAEVVENRA